MLDLSLKKEMFRVIYWVFKILLVLFGFCGLKLFWSLSLPLERGHLFQPAPLKSIAWLLNNIYIIFWNLRLLNILDYQASVNFNADKYWTLMTEVTEVFSSSVFPFYLINIDLSNSVAKWKDCNVNGVRSLLNIDCTVLKKIRLLNRNK